MSSTEADLGLERRALDELPAHLEHRYGVALTHTIELDVGVFRVDRRDGSSWVARAFPAARPVAEVDSDADLLRRLARAGFPAERTADPSPVSTLAGQGVLVTGFVSGSQGRGARTYAVLGALLGGLHARPGEGLRPGGAWHLVAPKGGTTRAEIDGALAMSTSPQLRARLAEADDCGDLPHAFVHPDFVPRNAIVTPEGETVVIDWAGAGRGPRLPSLGFLLWAAGAVDLRLVDVVLTRYLRHVQLEPSELARLAGAIGLRPLVLDCWSVAAGRMSAAAARRAVTTRDELVAVIAQSAKKACQSPTRAPARARPGPDPARPATAPSASPTITPAPSRTPTRSTPPSTAPLPAAAERPASASPARASAAPEPSDRPSAAPVQSVPAPTAPVRPPAPAPAVDVPVTTLLSQALVAYTIELDNEFEHRMPHRTTRHGASGAKGAPWLVSLAMWCNCMRYVGDEGITVGELQWRAGTGTNVDGMRRWGYVTVEPDEVLRPTHAGRRAQDVWRPLFAEVDERWQQRFGSAIAGLRSALTPLAGAGLPDCLPILRHGLVGQVVERTPPGREGADVPLVTLLARVALRVALEFERESALSLAVSQNVLRVLGQDGRRLRDLPGLTGVSRAAVDVSVALLAKQGHAVIEPAPDRGRQIRLTTSGQSAHDATRRMLDRAERRAGAEDLRAALEPMSGEQLRQGMTPHPDNWRAEVKPPSTLPHYPMVLHRGGFPDGS